MNDRLLRCLSLVLLSSVTTCALAASGLRAQEAEVEDELPGGMVAHYVDRHGSLIQRIDHALAFDWRHVSPDPRLVEGRFSVRWQGRLMSQLNGAYRLHAYFSGQLKVLLQNRVLWQAEHARAAWSAGPSITLPFDWHPLTIEYESLPDGRGQVQLFWSGPGFELEPLSAQLYHDAEATVSDDFSRGEALVRALRCAACHAVPAQPPPLPAPALLAGRGAWKADWLRSWLAKGHRQEVTQRRMPELPLSDAEVQALVACLAAPAARSASVDNPGDTASDEATSSADNSQQWSVEAGQQLFLSRGCLACHRWRQLGEDGLFAGGDLSWIADKRPQDFLATWLHDPASWNPAHRMPIFQLSGPESQQLTAFLSRQRRPPRDEPSPATIAKGEEVAPPELVARGKQLLHERGCSACHETTDRQERPKLAWKRTAQWRDSCVQPLHADHVRPYYRLDDDSMRAIQTYWSGVRPDAGVQWTGEHVLRERQCLSCHARGRFPGAEARLSGVLHARPDMARIAPLLKPPSLNSIGDKLHAQALIEAITARAQWRPWLEVQMPRYRLSDSEQRLVLDYLISQDRIPDRDQAMPLELSADPAIETAGRRLVTADGFGCTSCHQVGKVKPPNAPLNAQGPDLAQLDRRIRRSWYERWVRNPARIVPRMEMPSLKLAVNGVLQDNLDQQISAVWTVLNKPGFVPPEPNPVRVLRRSGAPDASQSALVATDVLHTDGRIYVKPLLLALPNRHNFLFDLEQGSLTRWWLGDAARQRTQGKTWYWEIDGDNLLPRTRESGQPDMVLVAADGRRFAPERQGQFITEIDAVEHKGSTLVWNYRLHYAAPSAPATVVHIEESWRPLSTSDAIPSDATVVAGGAERRLQIAGLPASTGLEMQIAALADASSSAWVGKRLWLDAARTAWVQVHADGGEMHGLPDGRWSWRPSPQHASPPGGIEVRLLYGARHAVDVFPQVAVAPPLPAQEALDFTPGFRAVRLPISNQIMPTGLAWRPHGELIVTSLKGRVWQLIDTNHDGIEDRAQPFSDELAAPYGAAAAEDYVDVINKFGLLRLYDRDRDGWAERWETLVAGWGHTADYHDWTVGLLREPDDAYIVATACQQDDRSPAAARWRGQVLRLAQRQPTADNPRRFEIQPVSAGHRFPMGLARNRKGDVFVTDNQGNYNPFNELNHVQQDRRYGFINKLERRDGFAPPLTEPAVNIPHPWTRSVNGICFLETPDEVVQRSGPRFGPWEGHLVGCEYDSRRLIRISLQRVGDEFQGAAYPLSSYHAPGGQAFLGPLVCAVAPDAKLYIGGIRDSGWGGANNVGELVQLTPVPELAPPGIAEMRAHVDGFEILFSQPVDPQLAADVASYHLSSFRRASTPEYGGADLDRRREAIESAELGPHQRSVRLRLSELRAGFVYELRTTSLVEVGEFFPAEAFYTLNRIPSAQP